jgi:hypothetical protein
MGGGEGGTGGGGGPRPGPGAVVLCFPATADPRIGCFDGWWHRDEICYTLRC